MIAVATIYARRRGRRIYYPALFGPRHAIFRFLASIPMNQTKIYTYEVLGPVGPSSVFAASALMVSYN